MSLFRIATVSIVAVASSLWLAQDPKTPPLKRQGKVLGDAETCSECHEEAAEAIAAGVHQRVPKAEFLQACETCHGPGELHAEEQEASQITLPSLLGIRAQRELCGGCHKDQIAEHGGPLSELLSAGKKCTSCHKVHQAHGDIPGAKDKRVFDARHSLVGAAEPRGMLQCLGCHKDKATSLEGRTHAKLLAGPGHVPKGRSSWHSDMTCESCHGPGSHHVATNGIARFITRPDTATDGIATCRSCHADVDAEKFHWKNGRMPLIGAAKGRVTCTTCHKVHADPDPTLLAPREPRRRPTSRPTRRPASSVGANQLGAHLVDRSLDATLQPDACVRCHAPAYEVLHGTVHESLGRLDLPAGTGCVSCHPGAGKHAASGGRKELVVSLRGTSAAYQSKLCSQCHGGQQDLCGYTLGVHKKAQVACLSCHSPAAPLEERRWKQDAHKNCGSCHADIALSFRHANRHPVGEAAFTCSSCHDPHRPQRLGLSSARHMSNNQCASCHREYRGPFVFAHHADKGLGCMACHAPHGSPNRKLLNFREVRQNCLSCHADLPSFHDQSAGSQYRNCLNCHTKIHGSNRNRFFFR